MPKTELKLEELDALAEEVEALHTVQDHIKELRRQEGELKRRLAVEVGEADGGTINGAMVVRIIRYTRPVVDQDALRELLPVEYLDRVITETMVSSLRLTS